MKSATMSFLSHIAHYTKKYDSLHLFVSAFKRPVDALEATTDEGASFCVCMDVEFAFFHRVDDFFRCHLWCKCPAAEVLLLLWSAGARRLRSTQLSRTVALRLFDVGL